MGTVGHPNPKASPPCPGAYYYPTEAYYITFAFCFKSSKDSAPYFAYVNVPTPLVCERMQTRSMLFPGGKAGTEGGIFVFQVHPILLVIAILFLRLSVQFGGYYRRARLFGGYLDRDNQGVFLFPPPLGCGSAPRAPADGGVGNI